MIILNTDSYKASHHLQYPPTTSYVSSYIEARGGDFPHHLFFGLQMFLQEYLSKQITLAEINQAKEVFTMHGLPFNENGWLHILNKHNGYLPLEIQAVEEGTILPIRNVLLQVVNTDPECFWLTSYIETSLLRAIWYPTTVATISYHAKKIITKYLKETADNLTSLAFKLHDFGARGVSSMESAGIGGCAHLINFAGTDTITSLLYANKYYDAQMAGFSIPASEHSTITCWGKDHEKDAYDNMLKQFAGKNKILAVVSDSYDIYNACSHIWGEELKEQVVSNGGIIVIRPDSGDPVTVVNKVISILMDKFGYETNKKGYKLLPSYIRVIQGDGINLDSITDILENLKNHNISAENIAFGMGGELLQKLSRDTLDFAMKASAAKINDVWIDIYKEPITDSKKNSKKGRLALIKDNGEYKTIRIEELQDQENMLKTIFKNGQILQRYSFDQIRENSNI
jgi:nicotinamide phosphoribosyltransferase